MVALLQPRLTYQVLAAPEVREVRDLRGKRLGVAAEGGGSTP